MTGVRVLSAQPIDDTENSANVTKNGRITEKLKTLHIILPMNTAPPVILITAENTSELAKTRTIRPGSPLFADIKSSKIGFAGDEANPRPSPKARVRRSDPLTRPK